MRSFELLSTIFNILLLGWVILARNKPQRGLLIGSGVSIILELVHGLAEVMRWKMIPIYAMTLVPIVMFALRRFFKPKEVKKKASRIRAILIVSLAVFYSVIAVALPIVLGARQA
ncbi:hypothetical protein ACM1RC_15115 [Paenibacillus azoreducens]|uniref:hypothetical protein n=1 Tax=Paenibacillus azoreducens TaxID=116718 RepID=UPI0039F638BE